jgi:hypothetical protein
MMHTLQYKYFIDNGMLLLLIFSTFAIRLSYSREADNIIRKEEEEKSNHWRSTF